jgi:Mrp family chromosome partitioning ATPase
MTPDRSRQVNRRAASGVLRGFDVVPTFSKSASPSARWQSSIEQIMLASARPQERVLGLTSLRPGAGVSLVCRHLARTAAASELKTLLLDMSGSHTPISTWRPGHDKISNWITPAVGGYDYIKVHTDETTRPLFGSQAKLRAAYRAELDQYELVVVDLPPLLEPSELGPNPVAVAGSCDRVLLLCAVGRDTRSQLADAISLVEAAGGKLAGLVANEHLYQRPLERFRRRAGAL